MTAEQPGDRFPWLEEALQLLVDDLDTIPSLKPDENPHNEDPYIYERVKITAVVVAFTKFMLLFPELEGKGWEDPLLTLTGHLRDVHEGMRSQLFSPPGQQARPKIATEVQFIRAHAAAAMQLFAEDDDCNNEEAAQRVARRLIHIKNFYLFTGKSEPHKQVVTWRKTVMGHADGEGAELYRYLVSEGKATGLNPEQAAKHLLELLSRKYF